MSKAEKPEEKKNELPETIPEKLNPLEVVDSTFETMKTGEYMVHVFIEETRGLINPFDAGSTVDAIIKIECMGHTRASPVKKGLGTGATNWGDHFFFEAGIHNLALLEHEKIKITVCDHKTIGADSRLGQIEMDFPAIYGHQKHTILHKWAALANVEKDFEKILGFIKYSVSLVTSGDAAIQLKPEDLGSGFDPSRVLLPPFLNLQMHQLTIIMNRAQSIKKMDRLGKVDPYVKVSFGPVEFKTKTITDNFDPVWQQIILIPIPLPAVTDTVEFQVYDYDGLQSNELIGTCHIKLKKIQDGKYNDFQWINLYGPPHKSEGKYRDIMNTCPGLAADWCGRLQVKMSLEAKKESVAKIIDFTDAKLLQIAKNEVPIKYELRAEAYWAMNLPENEKDYGLTIKWANMVTESKLKKVPKGRMVEWYESLNPIQIDMPHKSPEWLPDVIVWLKNAKDEHFSYARLPAVRYLNQDCKPETLFFKIDKSVAPKMRDNLAGVVRMRIWIHTMEKQADYSIGNWHKTLAKKPNMKKWKIIVNLYQAQDLIPADPTGSSDPICEIYFNGFIFTSQHIEQTLNPIWNFVMQFNAEFDEIEDCPPFLCTIWDWDSESKKDYLGGTTFNVDKSCFGLNHPNKPQWCPLKYGTMDKYFGKLLVSLNVLPDNIQMYPYETIEPKTEKYYLNMKVLGVRGLKSLGVFDVKKPFIKFDLNSLRSYRQRLQQEIKRMAATQAKESGPDANILTVINQEIELPMDPFFSPALSCRVHDFYLQGLAQPLLGTFSIPLKPFLEKTRERMEEKMKNRIAAGGLIKRTSQVMDDDVIEDDDEEAGLLDGDKKKEEEKKEEEEVKIEIKVDGAAEKNPNASTGSLAKLGIASLDEIVIKPKYEPDSIKGYEVEKDRPNLEKYIEIGFDSKGRKEKHYRLLLDKPLEETGFIDKSPFDEIAIKRGSAVDDDTLFSKIFSKKQDEDENVHDSETVGLFKAMITILSEEEKREIDGSPDNKLKRAKSAVGIPEIGPLGFPDVDFLKISDCVVRVYMIDAISLADKDENSNSDPYIILQLGKTKYDESKIYQNDEPNPKFLKCYEFPATLPGAGLLSIKVMDHDDLKSDELIGETTVDIEDRWFSKKFRKLTDVPVETREIYQPTSRVPQGSVRFFMEIFPRQEQPLKKKWDLISKPQKEFELRLIIWDCEEMPLVDASGMVDLYISAKLDDGTKLMTDTHWRSQNGKGSFNWRMIFKTKLPAKSNRISIQAWDKDVISANDFISEGTLDYSDLANEAFMYEQAVKMTGEKKKDEKIKVQCYRKKEKDDQGQLEKAGVITVSFELIPIETANMNKVGHGRSDPNQNPFLPPPIGRIQFSLNPLKMWETYIGPVYRRRIYLCCCLFICIAIFVVSLPQIFASIITSGL